MTYAERIDKVHDEIAAVNAKLNKIHGAIDVSRYASVIIAGVVIAAFVFGLVLRGWL